MKFFLLFLISLLHITRVNAQFLNDNDTKAITVKGLDQIYSLQFEKSEETLKPVKQIFANHPVHYLLNAIRLEWEFAPIDKNAIKFKEYTAELEKCISTAKVLKKNNLYKKEALFFLIAAHGFLALADNYKNNFMDAAQEGKKANDYYKEAKKHKTESAEFLFISGLYNFYIEQYPESHPIVKPLMVFFEKGNKALGLSELEIASKQSVFSRIEASTFLCNIYIKYLSNFKKALEFSNQLYQKYPSNYLFKIKNIECLLLNHNFSTAEKLNNTLSNRKDNVSLVSYYAFDGFLEEYYLKNPDKALVQYARALLLPADNRYTMQYHGMANLGMGKIYASKNEKNKAKAFFKRCIEISEDNWLKVAAKNELNKL